MKECKRGCGVFDGPYCLKCHAVSQREYVNTKRKLINLQQKEHRLNHLQQYLDREHKAARTLGVRFSFAKSSAKRRGIAFDLTRLEYEQLVQGGKCHYCNEPLPETGSGIDRKDSDGFYTFSNCVPCCFVCNTMKNAFLSYDEMLLIWRNRYASRSTKDVVQQAQA
jgi:hypothetical protein